MLLIRVTVKCGDDGCGSCDRGGGWGREGVAAVMELNRQWWSD